MLKRFIILSLLPILLFCACTKNTQEEITFSSWGSVTEVGILNNIIKEYEKENPKVKINFMHIPQNYFQKIHLLFAYNQAPDVIFINNLYLPLYVSKLEPLNNVVNTENFNSKSIEAMSINAKLYAVPRDISTLVFYRNKNLVKTTPQNLNELIPTIKEVRPYGISYEKDIYFMLPYVLTMNEDFLNPQKSAEFYKNLEGRYAPTASQVGSLTLAQLFLQGKIGLYLSGRWMYPKIKESADFEWDVIPFCGIVPLDASGWAISKNSKHKEQAEKFLNYLSSKKSIEYFNSTGLIIPARNDVKIDNLTFEQSIKNAKPLEYGKNYKKSADKLNKELF